MRNICLFATVSMLVACDGGLQFAHTSTLHQDTRGVALLDGDYARVGMSGTTCDVDPSYAGISTDYDYAGSEDTIHDVEEGRVIVTSDEGVHIIDRNPTAMGADEVHPTYTNARWTDAVATQDGAVILGETGSGCVLEWAGYGQEENVANLKPSVCEASPGIAVDPVTGVTWVGTADGISVASPVEDGIAPFLEEGADLMVFDSATELVYAATRGETEVRGLDVDGNEVWRADVVGGVTDVEDFGDRASALVSVAYADGTGGVLVLDGFTGELITELGTPDGNQRISSSEGGSEIALVRDNEVHFYSTYTWLPASLLDY